MENSIDEKTAKPKIDVKKEIISWIKTLLFAFLFAFIITQFIIVNASIPSGSMETTIMTNDRIVAFRLSYLFNEPERFDIVVFENPDYKLIDSNDKNKHYVKRIIGIGGDVITISEGQVYVNGEPITEPYIREPMYPVADMEFVVPADHYFMMGDNRNYSNDSRGWINKYVEKKKILGKVVWRYYPFSEIKTY